MLCTHKAWTKNATGYIIRVRLHQTYTTHLVLLPFTGDDAVAMARLTTPPGRSAMEREATKVVYMVGYE